MWLLSSYICSWFKSGSWAMRISILCCFETNIKKGLKIFHSSTPDPGVRGSSFNIFIHVPSQSIRSRVSFVQFSYWFFFTSSKHWVLSTDSSDMAISPCLNECVKPFYQKWALSNRILIDQKKNKKNAVLHTVVPASSLQFRLTHVLILLQCGNYIDVNVRWQCYLWYIIKSLNILFKSQGTVDPTIKAKRSSRFELK